MSPTLLHLQAVRDYLGNHFLLSVDTTEHRLALTFDDGPSSRNTPHLLDLLAEKGVRATFFLLGYRVGRHASLARRIMSEGHDVGSHGYYHVPMTLLPPSLLHQQIDRATRVIETTCAVRPVYFRPPFGWFNQRVLRAIRDEQLLPVLGNIHPRDSRRPGTDTILRRIQRRLVPGSIIILHDGGWYDGIDRDQTIEAVGRLIDQSRAQGYTFETITSLLESAEPETTDAEATEPETADAESAAGPPPP